jgi:hypothetical protein
LRATTALLQRLNSLGRSKISTPSSVLPRVLVETAITARLDSINRADSAIYIPFYGAFLAFFFLGMRELHRQVSMAGAWLAIGVCLADYSRISVCFTSVLRLTFLRTGCRYSLRRHT